MKKQKTTLKFWQIFLIRTLGVLFIIFSIIIFVNITFPSFMTITLEGIMEELLIFKLLGLTIFNLIIIIMGFKLSGLGELLKSKEKKMETIEQITKDTCLFQFKALRNKVVSEEENRCRDCPYVIPKQCNKYKKLGRTENRFAYMNL